MSFKFTKSLVVFGLILVLLGSGCVVEDFGGRLGLLGLTPTGPNYTAQETIKISGEAYPQEVEEGKEMALYFDVSNDGNITVSDFDLKFTDLCEFEEKDLEKSFEEVKPGDFEQWTWKIDAKEVENKRSCKLRYDVSYNTKSSAYYDVVALSESENQRLLRRGEMGQISLEYLRTKSPVQIDVSLSEEQPIVEGSSFYLYIKLRNVGGGYVEKIEKGKAEIKYPEFLELVGCDDFNNKGILDKDLEFLRGSTKTSTCEFEAKEGTVVRETGSLDIKISYKYMYHKTINVGIKPD